MGMLTSKRVAAYELIVGLTALGALLLENIARIVQGTYDPLDIWTYFTYQSNLIVAVVLLASSYSVLRNKHWNLDMWRGGATLYMVITGVVFALLVHSASPAIAIDNTIMHRIVPIAVVVAWCLHLPSERIHPDRIITWLYYPWLYAAFALIWGHVTGSYFYSFLDPSDGGYLPVVMTIVVLTLFAIIVSLVMTQAVPKVVDKLRRRRSVALKTSS